MKSSEIIRLLFRELPDGRHGFIRKLGDWDVPHDEIEMDPTDFPYFRNALIEKAIEEGDIQKK